MKFRFNYRSQALGEYTDVTVVIPTDGFSYYDVSQGARGGSMSATARRAGCRSITRA